jgi:DNA modification methylase
MNPRSHSHAEVEVLATSQSQDFPGLASLVPPMAASAMVTLGQRAIPSLAKDRAATTAIAEAVQRVPSEHQLIRGDSRRVLETLPDNSVHLVLTSPPYWTLKKYPDNPDQLGAVALFDSFLDELDTVWRESFRLLVPGGRLVVVVGDVCQSRRLAGHHFVAPLHAAIQERCRHIGFENLAPIIWHKITNAKFESPRSSGYLGKPFEPNAIIKNDIEFILLQRKPGSYRKPTTSQRLLSLIPSTDFSQWNQQIWNLPGASTHNHPAPFPLTLAQRLVRMFSFVGDTVLDPFMGTGTTNLAARMCGRDSIGIEVQSEYYSQTSQRLLDSELVEVPQRTLTKHERD